MPGWGLQPLGVNVQLRGHTLLLEQERGLWSVEVDRSWAGTCCHGGLWAGDGCPKLLLLDLIWMEEGLGLGEADTGTSWSSPSTEFLGTVLDAALQWTAALAKGIGAALPPGTFLLCACLACCSPLPSTAAS